MKFRKPMLAKEFEGNEHQVEYPCFIQPKIDGVRCITDGRHFWSRNGKLFPAVNLEHLQTASFSYLIDGELALPGHADFEDIVSIIKRAGHPEAKNLRFNAFDVMMCSVASFARRHAELKEMFQKGQTAFLAPGWSRIRTKKVSDFKQLARIHQQHLNSGYEGSMIRSAEGVYESKRTLSLLKWKPLYDDEFRIVAVREAKGKDKGTPIFVCTIDDSNDEDTQFRVRPMGSMNQRRKMWKKRDTLIGKYLTVEYQNLTKYGIPRFPRAKVLRDYE